MTDEVLSASQLLDRLHDRPEASLFVAFVVAPKYLRNGFTGVNQRRRRDDVFTRDFGQWIAENIDHQYGLYRGAALVPVRDVGELIYRFLVSVPDDLAKLCGSKNEAMRHPSQKKVVAGLLAAMAECRFVKIPKDKR